MTRPEEEAFKTYFFNGSPAQRILHNDLVRLLHREQARLESCSPTDLPGIQASVRAFRDVLAMLHKSDKSETKSPNPLNTYGR